MLELVLVEGGAVGLVVMPRGFVEVLLLYLRQKVLDLIVLLKGTVLLRVDLLRAVLELIL